MTTVNVVFASGRCRYDKTSLGVFINLLFSVSYIECTTCIRRRKETPSAPLVSIPKCGGQHAASDASGTFCLSSIEYRIVGWYTARLIEKRGRK